jgi:hypothetical protein
LTAALFSAPRTAYFPRILPRPEPIRELGQACPRPAAADPWRLLSAGTIPPFKLYRPGQAFLNSAFQNIIGPIERLAGEDDFHIDLFNSGHVPDCPPAEQEFGGYRTLFPAGRVDYHCGIPFPDLLATMGQYHFGLLLFSDSEMVVDYPLQESLPNRFAGYVSGHLPIIVNQEVRYCASLVQAFNAGITVSVDELDDLPLRIRAADLEAMRAGVKALHAFMAERNRQALQAFRHHIRARPAREASFGT